MIEQNLSRIEFEAIEYSKHGIGWVNKEITKSFIDGYKRGLKDSSNLLKELSSYPNEAERISILINALKTAKVDKKGNVINDDQW